jgi:hypothetical protein
MADIYIIHGSFGYPEENWFPWLKQEIEKLGHQAYIPAFPTPEGQELDIWLKTFEPYMERLNEQSIIVGHSGGSIFVLRVLERIQIQIKAAFFVGGPTKPLNNFFDDVHMSFVDHPVNWEQVRKHAQHFYPIYSTDDPYVGMEHGETTARELHTKLITVDNAGHFNTVSGYTQFPLLLDLIKGELR